MEAQYEYNPALQLNLLSDGTPVIDTDAMLGPTLTQSGGSGPAQVDDQ
ncbi:hypothetical protein ACFRCI_17375 [Streptomyces sp. NPDC056638]